MDNKVTVVFDFDGTLANSVELIVNLYNEHIDDFGYDSIDPSEFSALRSMSYRQAMRKKHIKLRKLPKMIKILGGEMRKRMNTVLPYTGIIGVLNELKDQGFSIGVLTSNDKSLVTEFFIKHKFPEFDFVESEKTLFGKEKAMNKIFKSKKLQKNRVIYVGDESRDVTASRKAGISVIGVTWGLGGIEGYKKHKPDVVVQKMSELLPAIKSLA